MAGADREIINFGGEEIIKRKKEAMSMIRVILTTVCYGHPKWYKRGGGEGKADNFFRVDLNVTRQERGEIVRYSWGPCPYYVEQYESGLLAVPIRTGGGRTLASRSGC